MSAADLEHPSPDYCRLAWEKTAGLQQAICEHPFNQALAEGTLDHRRFAFYMAQDARYLIGFSRTLAAASTRAPDIDAAAFFAGGAQQALVVERSLHQGELQRLGWSDEELASVDVSPTCLAYTSFLASIALSEPWPVLVGALLPCFWVYQHVGQTISQRTAGLREHPYRAWIDTYSDESFAASVARARHIADMAAISATTEVVDQMVEAFTRATEYEWLFWDSAWNLEQWPTARWLPQRGAAPRGRPDEPVAGEDRAGPR
jgi:thiaminase/transcriptional activator TenA